MSDRSGNGDLRQDLARAFVGFYRERFGRGPTQAKAHVEDDFALVILGEVQTPAERTLANAGEVDLVKQVRRTVKAVYRDELVALAEELTSRRVGAMHSDHDPATDTSVYVFLFERANGPGRTEPSPR
jgi:uncharacterized protein YbcI